jgi:hypothetical protein
MAADIIQINPNLYLVRWHKFPSLLEADTFIRALRALLDSADHKIAIISDLRNGYIKQVTAISKLSKLIAHPHCGPTTAFGSVGSQVYAGMFQKLVRHSDKRKTEETWLTLEQALAYLERMQPGVTAGLDFDAVANPPARPAAAPTTPPVPPAPRAATPAVSQPASQPPESAAPNADAPEPTA